MTNKEFYREFGNIDPKMIEAAAPAENVQKKKIYIFNVMCIKSKFDLTIIL